MAQFAVYITTNERPSATPSPTLFSMLYTDQPAKYTSKLILAGFYNVSFQQNTISNGAMCTVVSLCYRVAGTR